MSSNQRTEKFDMLLLHKIAIFLVTAVLIHTFLTARQITITVIEKPEFDLCLPYDAGQNSSENEDVYNQLIDIKNFSFLMNPQPCKNYSNGLLLLVIVASKPTNSENRLLIRNTWGHSTDEMQLVFLVGESDDLNVTLRIDEENYMFGDIVKGNFIDTYRNMTYKHIMGLKWVAHHCPVAKYVLKTDDDVFVHINKFKTFLARELSPWGARDLIACRLLEHAAAQRSASKWIVSVDEYPSTEYPPYCAGWAVLYSQDVIHRLLKVALETPYFWIDDVQVTGVLAEKIGVPRSPLNKFILPRHKIRELTKFGPQSVPKFLFGPYDLSLDNIQQMWLSVLQE